MVSLGVCRSSGREDTETHILHHEPGPHTRFLPNGADEWDPGKGTDSVGSPEEVAPWALRRGLFLREKHESSRAGLRRSVIEHPVGCLCA